MAPFGESWPGEESEVKGKPGFGSFHEPLDESVVEHSRVDSHTRFLEWVSENFWRSYADQAQGLWRRKQNHPGAMVDPAEFTSAELFDVWMGITTTKR